MPEIAARAAGPATPDLTPSPARLGSTVRRPRPVLDRGVALATGAVVAVLVVVLRQTGVLDGPPALVVALTLALAVPTSRLLSRRLVLVGALGFGAVPALWWWDLPVGEVGRAGLLLALLAGGLTTAVLWFGPVRARTRVSRLVPGFRPVDLIPLAAGGATAVITSGWLLVRSGAAALGALVPGWDNSAHYDMVRMIREHGATVDTLAAPDGAAWKFTEYPQGYHAVVATLMETTGPVRPGTVDAELVGYVQAQATVLVLVAVLLAAAVCALPGLHRRPLVALPLAALVVGAYAAGTGATSFAGGFPNFVLACALAATAVLLAVSTPRALMPLHLAALGALLVGVAHGWAPLLVLAGPAVALVQVPVSRARLRATRRQWLAAAAVAAATLVGLVKAVAILGVLDAGEVLVIPGGIPLPDAGVIVGIVLGSVAACLASPRLQVRWAAVVPLAGLGAAAVLGAVQLRTGGELSYYFWKLVLGVGLVSVAVAAAGLAQLRVRTPLHEPRVTLRAVAVALVAAVAASQAMGWVGGALAAFRATPTAATAELISAVEAGRSTGALRRSVLASPGSPEAPGLNPLNAQQWFLALDGSWTVQANDAAAVLLGDMASPEGRLAALEALLAQHPDAVVVVAPGELDALRATLGADLAARVVAW